MIGFFVKTGRKYLFLTLWYLRAVKGKISMEVTGRSAGKEVDEKCFDNIFDDINKKIGFSKKDTVLDIGCSNGELYKRIHPHVAKGILIDTSAKQLKLARCNVTDKNVLFLQSGASEFDLPECSVDKVICYSVIHYFVSYADFEKTMNAVYRVLKPGGKVIIGDIPFYGMQLKGSAGLNVKFMGLIYVRYFEKQVLRSVQKIGFRATIHSQAEDLPYSKTRKDLILEK